ncbi:MAG: PIG-L family deacetylase [Planctomycetes bacterium]|nr:PIG-L family deacetylase [Planctomycetota bacterium]
MDEIGKRRFLAVVVSPHLDDAVFSCGGLIARLSQRGQVLLLNLFTQFPQAKMVRAVRLGPERHAEEQAAARFLGVSTYSFNLLDAAFRRPEYGMLGNIFKPPVQDDVASIKDLREEVLGFLDRLDYEYLYVPLGIGWHVDHILTYSIFEGQQADSRIRYYEDAPYCLLPATTRYRLNELGMRHPGSSDLSLAHAGQFESWWALSNTYRKTALMTKLSPWALRVSAIPAVSFYLYRLLSYHKHLGSLHAKSSQAVRWEPECVPIDDAVDRKIDAMECYESQFKAFFHDRIDCRNLLESYAERITGCRSGIERLWRVVPNV